MAQLNRLTRATAEASLPEAVPLALAKQHCEVDHDDRDDLITAFIHQAARAVEAYTGVLLGEQQWTLKLDAFTDAIELPLAPVVSVESITYRDAEGASQTLSDDIYTLDITSRPQWIVRNSDQEWPELLDAVNAVTISFTAGSDTIEQPLQAAVLATVAAWFDNRSSAGLLPEAVMQALDLAGYRMIRI